MFYLKEFLSILKENLILGVLFFVSSVGLLTVTHHRDQIKQELSLAKKSNTLPYFNALISNETKVEGIIRRMRKLPGVNTIQQGSQTSIQNEIVKLKKKFGEDVIKGLSAISYKKIKIELDQGLRASSYNLIREYLTRLVGANSVTIGEIRTPKQVKLKGNDPLLRFLNFADIYAMGIFVCLWLGSVFLLLKPVNTSAFIIERFQRRKMTNIKILLSGLTLFVLPIMTLNYLSNSKVEIYSLITFGAMIGITSLLTLSSKSKV